MNSSSSVILLQSETKTGQTFPFYIHPLNSFSPLRVALWIWGEEVRHIIRDLWGIRLLLDIMNWGDVRCYSSEAHQCWDPKIIICQESAAPLPKIESLHYKQLFWKKKWGTRRRQLIKLCLTFALVVAWLDIMSRTKASSSDLMIEEIPNLGRVDNRPD